MAGIGPWGRITRSPNYMWWAYFAIAIGLFLTVMDQTGVHIALPKIAEHFAADIPTVQWIALGYGLATSAMFMPMGRLSDVVGRKRVFLGGFAVFIAFAALGGFSQSLRLVIAAKILQGIGASGIQANGMAMVAEVFPERDRGKALGLYMTIIGTGAISGPIVGGVLVSQFGWRSIFFAGIPVGFAAVAAAALVLKGQTEQEARAGRKGSFDWLGAAISSTALVVLLLALTNAWSVGWASAPIVAGIAASIALTAAFIWWELRASAPMLDTGLFRNRVFSMAIGARFLSFLAGSSVFFLMPFYLIQGLGYSASRAALIMVPGSICMALLGPFAGRLSDRVGTRWPASIGLTLSSASMLVFATLSTDSPGSHVVIGMALAGTGMALFSSPNSSAILGTLPREKYGVVSGFVNLTRTSANVSGVALATLIVTLTMASTGHEPSLSAVAGGVDDGVKAAFVQGMGRAYVASGAMMAVALALTVGRGETVDVAPSAQPAPSRSPGDD